MHLKRDKIPNCAEKHLHRYFAEFDFRYNSRAAPSRKRKPKGGKENPDKPQSERFKETARALEADESGGLFERAFKKIVPPKRPGNRQN